MFCITINFALYIKATYKRLASYKNISHIIYAIESENKLFIKKSQTNTKYFAVII